MRNAIVALLLLGGMQGAAWGQTAPATDPAVTDPAVTDPVATEPAADLPVADLSDPDLIYDPETDTYYDPQTGDVFAAPAPLTPDPNAPTPGSQSAQQAPIPTNFGPLQTGIYAGAGMNTLEFKSYGIQGTVGYDFNKNFGVEAQLGFGIADDEELVEDVQIPFRITDDGTITTLPAPSRVATGYNSSIAAYAVARAPIGNKIEVLGRAGYHFTSLGGSILTFRENQAFGDRNGQRLFTNFKAGTSGLAAGVGVQYNFGDFDLQAIRLDYTYLDFGTIDEANISILEDDIPVEPGGVYDGGLNFLDGGNVFTVSLMQRF